GKSADSKSADGKVTDLVLASTLPDKDKPFVVLRKSGQRADFRLFWEALDALTDGDTIEVHGNGPFALDRVRVVGKGLTVRAAAGYRPRFVPTKAALEKQEGSSCWFTLEKAPLSIDGCDLVCDGFDRFPLGVMFAGGGGPWEFRNCRLGVG